MTSLINASTSAGVVITPDTSGVLALQTAGTTAISIDASQNVNFAGTAQRITGDFSNATVANRVAFQSSTTNGASGVIAIPNGTGLVASWSAQNSSDANNSANVSIRASDTDMSVRSGILGTGTYLPMTFYTGGSERVRIDTSGNVGIGTSSPTALLTAGSLSDGTPATYGGTIKVASATQTSINSVGGIELNVATGYSTKIQQISSGGANLTFCGRQSSATWSEYMRIDPSGNLLVNTTSVLGSGTVSVKARGGTVAITAQSENSGSAIAVSNTSGTANYNALVVYNNTLFGTIVGSINCSGSTTNFNTSSDYRLKENLVPLVGAKDFILSLKPKQGVWKVDGSKFVGFVAHEFAEISPTSVNGEKDAVDSDGKPIYQGMQAATSEVMANLISFVQEQQALITQLQADVAALKGATA
jgi:hypothetical protein